MRQIEEKKIVNSQLPGIADLLSAFPPKNPLAYEISRAVKSVGENLLKFEDDRNEIMRTHLYRNEDGSWELTEETAASLKAGEEKGLGLVPTVFGYRVEEGKEEEYIEKMRECLTREVELKCKSVDAKSKMIKLSDNSRVTLIDCLADYFEASQINILESLNVLVGLD